MENRAYPKCKDKYHSASPAGLVLVETIIGCHGLLSCGVLPENEGGLVSASVVKSGRLRKKIQEIEIGQFRS